MNKKEHYLRWNAMKNRCYNPKHTYYKNYGGRGITICDEWKDNFESFYKWACSSGYKKGLTLDRIDNNKGYSPGNCRWATKKEQGRNTRTNRKITINGKTKLLCEWAEENNISSKNILKRIRRGWKNEDLLKPLANTKKIIFYRNESHTISEWSEILNIPKTTISSRLNRGLNPFENHDSIRKEAARKATSKVINQYSKDGIFIRSWKSIAEAAKKNNMVAPSISGNLRGKTKSVGGYIWEYA